MNKQEFTGRIVADPQLRTAGDKQVCSFRMAVRTRGINTPDAFINCEAWGKMGEAIARYAAKGKPIGVVTHLKQHSYDKDGVKITADDFVVEDVDFLEPKKNGEEA